jgi:hypothetical protein
MNDYNVYEQLQELFANKDGGLFRYEPGLAAPPSCPPSYAWGSACK